MPRHRRRRQRATRTPGASDKRPGRSAAPISSSRRRWFRLLALTLIPLLLVVALEAGLRVFGYGYPTSFFVRSTVNGRTVYVENENFGFRFFPRSLARSPSPLVMEPVKGSNTFRIFLFGESAALGDPDPAFGPGRFLEVLLRERYPETRFEVLCVAMTAINSHALLPMAKECTRHGADLWLIYAGNNEMMGPFGAGTIFGPRTPPMGFIRASLALKTTRVGQLLSDAIARLRPNPDGTKSWRGLGMFSGNNISPGDPARKRVYAHFQKNLAEMVALGRKSGAKVVVSTVASNLRDCPPFASLHGNQAVGTQSDPWEKLYREGREMEESGRYPAAIEKYSAAALLDPAYAEVQFRLGTCQAAVTNLPEARRSFESARDFDALPFRTDSGLNRIIREVASGEPGTGPRAALLDAETVFASSDAAGIPGKESFYEHVHFTIDGAYRLARAFADEVSRVLPPAQAGKSGTEWVSGEFCSGRLGLTAWNEYRIYETMLERTALPPFSGQANAAARQKYYREKMAQTRTRMASTEFQIARQVCLDNISRQPDDFYLHRKFAEMLEFVGDLKGAEKEWERFRELLPHHPVSNFQLGRILAREGKNSAAETWLRQAVRIRADFVEARDELGRVLAAQKKFPDSLEQFRLGLKLQPENALLHFHFADALAADEKRPEAMIHLREAVRLKPAFWEARYLLGVELAVQGKVDEARQEFTEVTRLKPGYALGHLNLGVALARQGRMGEAMAQFQETLRLDPGNKSALNHIQSIRSIERGR